MLRIKPPSAHKGGGGGVARNVFFFRENAPTVWWNTGRSIDVAIERSSAIKFAHCEGTLEDHTRA